MRLGEVMIFVKDLDLMTTFYRDVIGLSPNEATRRADWVEFEDDGAALALHAIPQEMSQHLVIASPPVPREAQALKLVLSVEDVDATLIRLEGLGVLILRRAWGGWDLVDPEGNVLGVRARTK